jgi:predicted molibdopterin-dependent oxidoreductase YjgC
MHDSIVDPWGPRSPVGSGEPWSERVDEFLLDGTKPDRWVQTASVLHSGDAYDVAVQDGRLVGVRGRAGDRVNRGRLGPKDLFGWQANASVDRLATPLVRRDGELRPASWEEAMGAIVGQTRAVLEEQGPSGLGFYTSGQLFLEEYYTLATIVRGGLSCNLSTGTRACARPRPGRRSRSPSAVMDSRRLMRMWVTRM